MSYFTNFLITQCWLYQRRRKLLTRTHMHLPATRKSWCPKKTEPSTSQTPNFNATALQIGGATRSEQGRFRADASTAGVHFYAYSVNTLIAQIAAREQYKCAITQYFDFSHAKYLINNGRGHEAPHQVPRMRMQAAHITPFSLNKFDKKDLVSCMILVI